MNKSKGEVVLDESKYYPSAFTLTFVVEAVDTDVWQDCGAGWLELGSPAQRVKLSYQLYPGQTFDVDVVLWPHVAKVSCGTNYSWVRTWQFLERRWLSFSVRHAFPVKVMDLRDFEMTLIPNFGLGALSTMYDSKLMAVAKVFLPPLRFGERRQFAEVVESECPLNKYIEDMIWFLVVDRIPTSILDGPFETPYPVQDVRHQDAALYKVRNAILNNREKEEEENDKENIEKVSFVSRKEKHLSKTITTKQTTEKANYEIKLPGDWILAGIGRVTPFVTIGNRPKEQGEVIALISSTNLPAQHDFSICFVNVCNLTDVPIEHLQQNRFTHIYTRWAINDEEHDSEKQSLQTKQPSTEIDFNDHHSVPLPTAAVSEVMATFLDEPFQIELRGIRVPVSTKPAFFGYNKADSDYDTRVPPPEPYQDIDVLIAQTKIDVRALAKINGSVKGEFPLYPPETSVMSLERKEVCTNDINAVRAKMKPDLVIQPGVILQAQMTLEVSLGIVGCKPKTNAVRYSRLYCLVSDRDAIMALLREITAINESVMLTENKADLLTGFALDTGDTVILYVEGPKQGSIVLFWQKTEDFYPSVKPVFSTSAKYSRRLYPDLLLATMPFIIMKMVVPLSVLLGVTSIYARPALPLPTRSALMKIGRLIASKLENAPCSSAMPTTIELTSFRLELCAPPRPPSIPDQNAEDSSPSCLYPNLSRGETA